MCQWKDLNVGLGLEVAGSTVPQSLKFPLPLALPGVPPADGKQMQWTSRVLSKPTLHMAFSTVLCPLAEAWPALLLLSL